MKFEIDDLVVYQSDREQTLHQVMGLPEEGKMAIARVGGAGLEQEYQHLMTLAEPILQFFRYKHLPKPLQEVSLKFCALATSMVLQLPRSPERTVALRKLLEAKDAAVRASIYES